MGFCLISRADLQTRIRYIYLLCECTAPDSVSCTSILCSIASWQHVHTCLTLHDNVHEIIENLSKMDIQAKTPSPFVCWARIACTGADTQLNKGNTGQLMLVYRPYSHPAADSQPCLQIDIPRMSQQQPKHTWVCIWAKVFIHCARLDQVLI